MNNTKYKKITIIHCRRFNIGGEDVALERIALNVKSVSLLIRPFRNSRIVSTLKFLFSPWYFIYVLRNPTSRHVICNPFPDVSILSIILLRIFSVKLRLYIHNFSFSCLANTHYRNDQPCFESTQVGLKCFRLECNKTTTHFLLNGLRNYLFNKIFLNGRCNKIYFVGSYQARLAKSVQPRVGKYIRVGNIL